MKNPIPLPLGDPSAHFTPDDAIGQWIPCETQPLSGPWPPPLARVDLESPEWLRTDSGAASRGRPFTGLATMPLAAEGASSPPDEQVPDSRGTSPGHINENRGNLDGRNGPIVVEDPPPEDGKANEEGDANDHQAPKHAVLVAGPRAPEDRENP